MKSGKGTLKFFVLGVLFSLMQFQAGALSAVEEPANPPVPSQQEILKKLDDSIAKIEESIKQFDAQIAEADKVTAGADVWGPEHAESVRNDLKSTALTYKPILEEQLKNLKAMRQQAALKAGGKRSAFGA